MCGLDTVSSALACPEVVRPEWSWEGKRQNCAQFCLGSLLIQGCRGGEATSSLLGIIFKLGKRGCILEMRGWKGKEGQEE